MPDISIGLPVYNGQKLIRNAIESTLAQTHGDFELIISDNASTDGTATICREYASLDGRIKYFRSQVNLGAAANFRKVFHLASGRYFKWIGVDDYCAPAYLEQTKRVLDSRDDVVLCCSKVNIIDGEGVILRQYPDAQALLQSAPSERFKQFQEQDSWVNAVYGLMRSEALRKTSVMGTFPGSDIVLIAELSLHGKFVELPDYLFFRRIHPEAFSYEPSLEKQQEFYNPGKPKRLLPMYTWRHLYEHVRSIRRAPIDASEKWRVIRHLLNMARWQRHVLFRELRLVFKSAATQESHP